jgi:flagellar basal-body rod protein FlgB
LSNGIFSSPAWQAMEKALDGSALRQRMIANNIANVETPNYKAMEVTFEDQLKQALQQGTGSSIKMMATDPRHITINNGSTIANVQPAIETVKDFSIRNDKNNVDIDRESAKLAQNEIYYDTVTRMMNDEFSLLRMVISEGRK